MALVIRTPLPNPAYQYVSVITKHTLEVYVECLTTSRILDNTRYLFSIVSEGNRRDKFGRLISNEELKAVHHRLMCERFSKPLTHGEASRKNPNQGGTI